METPSFVQYAMGALMLTSVAFLLYSRHVKGLGIGARFIQLVCVVLIVPAIVILAIQKILTADVVATLFGAITGYVLSGIGSFKSDSDD